MNLAAHIRLAQWSLRKVQLGIPSNALVLDVGSGANPHPRADVLLEKYISGRHRHGTMPVADRPMVFADACSMPFKDKAFDFIIAFHVLEHMPDPASFLKEISRVGRAGYIETPNVLFERLVPYDVHLLEIMDLDGRLYIQKKASHPTDPFSRDIQIVKRHKAWNRLLYGNPDLFHVRYFWKDTISFEVINPEQQCTWFIPRDDSDDLDSVSEGARREVSSIRSLGLSALRRWHKVCGKRIPRMNELLVCPLCHGPLSAHAPEWLECATCAMKYPSKPWPNFNSPAPL